MYIQLKYTEGHVKSSFWGEMYLLKKMALLCLCTTNILVQFYCHRPKMQNSPKMANPSQASPKATPQASCSLPQRSSRCSWQVGAISVVTDDNSNLALCHFFFPNYSFTGEQLCPMAIFLKSRWKMCAILFQY